MPGMWLEKRCLFEVRAIMVACFHQIPASPSAVKVVLFLCKHVFFFWLRELREPTCRSISTSVRDTRDKPGKTGQITETRPLSSP